MSQTSTKQDQAFAERLQAKWISSPDEKPDRPGQTLATRSHEVIRRWAEARNARPATATRGPEGEARTLRLDFGEQTEGLEPMSWDEWFGRFDERNLVFLYQEQKSDGAQSNFWRLVSPEREDA